MRGNKKMSGVLRGGRAGFTMIELMVALSLALVIGYAVFYMYTQSIDSYAAAEKELKFLSGFRTSTDFIEREVNSMCWKGGYLPTSGGGGLKKVNDGMFTTLMFNHCFAFYTSLDGVHIDRVAYYFNPPEDQLEWENGEDDDNDDPQAEGILTDSADPRYGLFLFVDDKGSFVRRRWLDSELKYLDYSNNKYYETPAPGPGLPTFCLPTGMIGATADMGEIMADEFSDITFWYVYTNTDSYKLYYGDRWPYDDDADIRGDKTGLKWGTPTVGLSYLTVPLGIQVDFHYELDGADRVLSKLMIIYSSKWQELVGYVKG